MNKGKTNTNIKEDMFKNHPVLGPICTATMSKMDEVIIRFSENLRSYQVTHLDQGYLGNLRLLKACCPIKDCANISINTRTFVITVHTKDKIADIVNTIQTARNLTVNQRGNELQVIVPDPTSDRREKIITEMKKETELYVTQINTVRTEAIEKIKDLDKEQKKNKKNKDKTSIGVSEDDLETCKAVIEKIKSTRQIKITNLLEKQEEDIRSGRK